MFKATYMFSYAKKSFSNRKKLLNVENVNEFFKKASKFNILIQ